MSGKPPVGFAKSKQNRTHGLIEFTESDPYFADNNLGTGAVVVMAYLSEDRNQVMNHDVRLTWIDWNRCRYESV